MHEPIATGLETISREDEIAVLHDVVRGSTNVRAVVVSGPPGVGKTTLWRAALEEATAAGLKVLVAKPAEAEASLPFAALSDLLAGIDDGAMAGMPAPQRRALDVALLRVEAGGSTPQARAIALGLLHVLARLADRGPVLLAIDDVQWADAASLDPLAFALRRAPGGLRVILASRPPLPAAIEAALDPGVTRTLALSGLTLGATRRLLLSRLGLEMPRHVARRVHDVTLGNPMFVLEIGRAIAAHGLPTIGQALPLPDSLEETLAVRISAAPADARRALVAVALGGPTSAGELDRLVGGGSAESALASRLLVAEDDRLAPAHPLLASVAVGRSSAVERGALHQALSEATNDPVRRAWHLASVARGRDADLATRVADGARDAARRGALETAIELMDHAVRLTPPDDGGRSRRVLDLGAYLNTANELARLRQLLDDEMDSLATGQDRAMAYLLRQQVPENEEEHRELLVAALREAAGDTGPTRALALAALAQDFAVAWLADLERAERHAEEALPFATNDQSRSAAAAALAWARLMRGKPIDDLPLGSVQDGDGTLGFVEARERLLGLWFAYQGRIADARRLFELVLERSVEYGQEDARYVCSLQLSELALRAGDLAAAARVMDEMEPAESSERMEMRSIDARLRAVAAATRGDPEGTATWAARTMELVAGKVWDEFEAQRAVGVAGLLTGDASTAMEAFLVIWRHTEAEQVGNPGVFPVAGDLVEAALGAGDLELARGVAERLAALAAQSGNAWAAATIPRAEGLLAAASGDLDRGRELIGQAVAEYDQVGCRFDAARSLLALGRAARRARKWAVAREALSAAATRFGALGCDGWATHAADLLEGLGGRRPAARGALTPSERRVAALASAGQSNKEIAASLFVSVHTVEVHLAHAYAKLGVQSRAQLSRALATAGPEPAPSNH